MSDAAIRIPPPAFFADPALAPVLAAVPHARVVGGAVRDALLGREVADIDLATPDPPDAVAAALKAAGLRAVPTGLAHGTITAVSGHRGFEITTLRSDVETDGRHAVVAFTTDWRADAARRDFTINAMSMTPDGSVFDYFGGVGDLRTGRVRFVGEAAVRIREDFLRILRFFRFFARYGRGEPDPPALAAIAANVDGLARLSAERVWSELKNILAAPDPAAAIALMDRLGVLAAVMPEGTAPARLAALLATGAPPDPMLRLAALLDGDHSAFAARLRLSAAERETLAALQEHGLAEDADDADLRRALADTTRDILINRAWLDGAVSLISRLEAAEKKVFPIQGRDLKRAGVPDGPELGRLLRDLRGWWLQGGCVADADEILAELAKRRRH